MPNFIMFLLSFCYYFRSRLPILWDFLNLGDVRDIQSETINMNALISRFSIFVLLSGLLLDSQFPVISAKCNFMLE